MRHDDAGGLPGTTRPADRCPGALSLHVAQDGLLARVRLPGGFVAAPVLLGLADVAETAGDGRLELTSRGNVQVRGVRPAEQDRLANAVAALGLLPSRTHERVRNIVASPLAGLDGSGPDLREVVERIDAALCADQVLSELSGRFLVAVDDGRGDMAELRPDVTARHRAEDVWTLYPGGFEASTAGVAGAVVTLARQFLAERAAQGDGAWRIADLVDGPERVAARAAVTLGASGARPPGPDRAPAHPAGVVGSAVMAVVPLGRLTAAQTRALARLLAAGPARITPWRSVVLPVAAPDQARDVVHAIRAAGLDVGADSIWNNLTACTGWPGCAKSLTPVLVDAAAAATAGRRVPSSARALDPGLPVHWSGCSRRCGHPGTDYVDVLATVDGYRSAVRGPEQEAQIA